METKRHCKAGIDQSIVAEGKTRFGQKHIPVWSTFAIPPVAIVMVKKVQVKCRMRSRHSSFSNNACGTKLSRWSRSIVVENTCEWD